jgi:hypothetical protein
MCYYTVRQATIENIVINIAATLQYTGDDDGDVNRIIESNRIESNRIEFAVIPVTQPLLAIKADVHI